MSALNSIAHNQETAGVPFPPPLAFIGGLGLGFGMHYVIPAHIARTTVAINALGVAGGALGVAALVLAVWAFSCFRLARTSPFPERATTSLVVRGPFRFTRNPLYLAMTLLHAGVALFANAVWPVVFLLPAVAVIRLVVIAREERYLVRLFGAEYEAYCRSVRRWL